jgi:hypothetical protein
MTASKTVILDLLRRKDGISLDDIMKATKWQAHSVGGFIAGPIKKASFTVESGKNEAGERTYRIVK